MRSDVAPLLRAERSVTPPDFAYQPALDGLRAVAVVAVLLFHGGFGWMSGGYLGVSVFFTLSGFLITSLLVGEAERTGRVDLGRFASRRIRRLLPASIVCLFLVTVCAAAGWFDSVAGLRRDVLMAALQVANWGQLTAGESYADLFRTGTSPVAHYWSLAIEEQFYVVWPVVCTAAIAVGRRRRRSLDRSLLRWVTTAFVIAALAPLLIRSGWGRDAVYLSTPARLAELFAGAVLAVALRRCSIGPRGRWLATGAASLAALLFVVTPAGHGWAYAGGLPLFALVSASLIAGVQVPGPVRSLLSVGPLVALGRISYGVYLFHWPVFVLFDERWPRVHDGWLFVAKCAITLVLALLSDVFVERPIRAWRIRPVGQFGIGVLATVGLCAIVTVGIAGPTSTQLVSIDPQRAAAVAIEPRPIEPMPAPTVPSATPVSAPEPAPAGLDADATVTAAAPVTVPSGPPPVRVLVVGDSTSMAIGAGLVYWAFDDIGVAQVSVMGLGGCGLVHEGLVGTVVDMASAECERRMRDEVPEAVETLRPDVVVVSINVADSWARSFDDGQTFVPPADPYYSALIATGYRDFFASVVTAGAPHVVWLDPPSAAVYGRNGVAEDPTHVAAARAVVDDAVVDATTAHPGVVTVLGYREWLEASAILDDPANRPDGVHLSDSAALRVAAEWLGPELVAIGRTR